jgi:hypothetical protein
LSSLRHPTFPKKYSEKPPKKWAEFLLVFAILGGGQNGAIIEGAK